MAAKSSVSTVTQARVPAVFAVPPAFSTLPQAAIIVKMEDTASILQDLLWRIKNMFTGIVYQTAHGGASTAYAQSQQYTAPLQQYTAQLQQYAAPSQQYATPPPQKYSTPPPQPPPPSPALQALAQSKNVILTDVLG
jgi:hypothetical protein